MSVIARRCIALCAFLRRVTKLRHLSKLTACILLVLTMARFFAPSAEALTGTPKVIPVGSFGGTSVVISDIGGDVVTHASLQGISTNGTSSYTVAVRLGQSPLVNNVTPGYDVSATFLMSVREAFSLGGVGGLTNMITIGSKYAFGPELQPYSSSTIMSQHLSTRAYYDTGVIVYRYEIWSGGQMRLASQPGVMLAEMGQFNQPYFKLSDGQETSHILATDAMLLLVLEYDVRVEAMFRLVATQNLSTIGYLGDVFVNLTHQTMPYFYYDQGTLLPFASGPASSADIDAIINPPGVTIPPNTHTDPTSPDIPYTVPENPVPDLDLQPFWSSFISSRFGGVLISVAAVSVSLGLVGLLARRKTK